MVSGRTRFELVQKRESGRAFPIMAVGARPRYDRFNVLFRTGKNLRSKESWSEATF